MALELDIKKLSINDTWDNLCPLYIPKSYWRWIFHYNPLKSPSKKYFNPIKIYTKVLLNDRKINELEQELLKKIDRVIKKVIKENISNHGITNKTQIESINEFGIKIIDLKRVKKLVSRHCMQDSIDKDAVINAIKDKCNANEYDLEKMYELILEIIKIKKVNTILSDEDLCRLISTLTLTNRENL